MLNNLFLEGFRMPGEWEKQKSVWIVCPYNKKDWPGLFDKIPEVPHNIRYNINKQFKKKGLIWLQEKVQSVDPEFYKTCDPNNSQRLIRALEIFKSHNKYLSSFKTESYKERPFEIIKIGLNTNRELLYKKIMLVSCSN